MSEFYFDSSNGDVTVGGPWPCVERQYVLDIYRCYHHFTYHFLCVYLLQIWVKYPVVLGFYFQDGCQLWLINYDSRRIYPRTFCELGSTYGSVYLISLWQPIKFDVLSYNGCDDHCYRSWSWSLSNESDTCIFALYFEHPYHCWFRNWFSFNIFNLKRLTTMTRGDSMIFMSKPLNLS